MAAKGDKRTTLWKGAGTKTGTKGTYVEFNAGSDPAYDKRNTASKPVSDPSVHGGDKGGYVEKNINSMPKYNMSKGASAGKQASDPSAQELKAGPKSKVGTASQSTGDNDAKPMRTPYGHYAFSTRTSKDSWDK